MKSLAITLYLLLAATAALAATYQWTDKKGVLHFTDNPDRIPAEYQQRAREVTVETPAPLKFEEPAASEATSPTAPSRKGEETIYCGRDSESWREQFRNLRQERLQLTEALPAIENELLQRHNRLQRSLWDYKQKDSPKEETKGSTRVSGDRYGRPSANRKKYQETYAKREEANKRIADIDRNLAELETEAARCSVPLYLRQ